MFCDDDDMYATDRVLTLKSYLNLDNNGCNVLHDESKIINGVGTEVELDYTLDLINTANHDFANYVVKFNILGEFFEKSSPIVPSLIGMTDLVFMRFLEEMGCKKIAIQLYYKRKDRSIPMMTQSWDKKRDFDFAAHAIRSGLDKKFC